MTAGVLRLKGALRREQPSPAWFAVLILMMFGSLGCGSIPGEVPRRMHHRIGIAAREGEEARRGVEQLRLELSPALDSAHEWLEIVPFRASLIYWSSLEKDSTQRLAVDPKVECRAILSFPESENSSLRSRSYTYDMALAILYFAWRGELDEAMSLAETLVLLQNADGGWGFSFMVPSHGYSGENSPAEPVAAEYMREYVRNAGVAWVVHSPNVLGAMLPRQQRVKYEEAAFKGALYLAAQRERLEKESDSSDATIAPQRVGFALVKGGRGIYSDEGTVFHPGVIAEVAVTEHQFDAHMALAPLFPEVADELAKSIMSRLWMDDIGLFVTAATPYGLHVIPSLDSAGGWGALWLLSIGNFDHAQRSFGETLRKFAIDPSATGFGGIGFRPYLNSPYRELTDTLESLVFVEGTLGVGMAAWRLGRPDVAFNTLLLAMEMQASGNREGMRSRGGIPGASQSVDEFVAEPTAASTLWFLFLGGEVLHGKKAPVFIQR